MYMACDEFWKELLKKKEKSGILNKVGGAEDKNRVNIMQ